MFAAFVPGVGTEVARGGRYDQTDEPFGRPRPATGFSADLRLLMTLADPPPSSEGDKAIFAPVSQDPELGRTVDRLRAKGERVVEELPGQAEGADRATCDRRLERVGAAWKIVPLDRE